MAFSSRLGGGGGMGRAWHARQARSALAAVPEQGEAVGRERNG